MSRSILPALALASLALARTDHEGCTSFTSTVTVRTEIGYGNTYETVIWYVPDTLEICQGVDCGGGRAPPRNVPGCPIYSGTETVTPKFLPTDPAAKPAAGTTVVTVTPTRTSTVETVTRTATAEVETTTASASASASRGVVESLSVSIFLASSGVSGMTESASGGASGGASGTAGGSGTGAAASTTATPAGAGPTARAGLAAALGIAAAVALV